MLNNKKEPFSNMTRHIRTCGQKPLGKKKKKKPVDNQPARYNKKPAGKKPGTKKKVKTSGQKTRVKTTGPKRTGSNVKIGYMLELAML